MADKMEPEEIEYLKKCADLMGLDEKQKSKFLLDEWRKLMESRERGKEAVRKMEEMERGPYVKWKKEKHRWKQKNEKRSQMRKKRKGGTASVR